MELWNESQPGLRNRDRAARAASACAQVVTLPPLPTVAPPVAIGLVLLLVLSGPLAARTVCHTGLTGVTVCSDGGVSRTNLHGTRIDNAGNVRRTTLMGVTLSNDGNAARSRAGGLRDADGRLWNSDPFPAFTGPIGGVGCETSRRGHHLCN